MPKTRRRITALRGILAGLVLWAAGGCASDRSVAPPTEETGPPQTSTCGQECTLADNTAPLAAAQYFADSTQFAVELGELTVRGRPGNIVGVQLETEPSVLRLMSTKEQLRIEIEGKPNLNISLSALTEETTVFRFQESETVRIRYSLTRHMTTYPSGQFRLIQRTTGVVISGRRIWVRALDEPSLTLAPTGNCPISAESGTVCGVGYTVSPFVPGGLGATFQSDAGTGPSHPITITFGRAITQVFITIYDPDYAGNRAEAYDVNGNILGQVSFSGDGTPGEFTTETQTLTAGGIRRLELIPSTGIAQGDYVAYDVSINPDSSCMPQPPDPILEAQNVRDAINQEYQFGLQQGQERAGWIYQNDTTGEYLLQPELNPAHRDACEVSTPTNAPPLSGFTPRGSYHTHVLNEGQTSPGGCLHYPPGQPVLNGPSIGDLNFPKLSGIPDYMIDQDQIYTIDQNGFPFARDWTRDNFCRN